MSRQPFLVVPIGDTSGIFVRLNKSFKYTMSAQAQHCEGVNEEEEASALSWSKELYEIFMLAYPAALQLLFQ